jgi:hypothetical protein
LGAVKSTILSVLGLLTPQDLKLLTNASRQKAAVLKKAAGAEGMFWDEAEEDVAAEPEGDVLEFPRKSQQSAREFTQRESPLEAIGVLSSEKQAQLKKEAHEAYEKSKPDTFDFVLVERDRFRESEEKIFKQNGLASYRRNSDLRLYRVTVTDPEGKEKTRITGTQGILVDKKQA